jgi:SAM-dependent methyltransferase
MDIARALDLDGLRAGLLGYTRLAFSALHLPTEPRILDLGCGDGLPTIELARLSGAPITAVDIDGAALGRLRSRLVDLGLVGRILPARSSALATCFASARFDLVWEEGVLHLLDAARALSECARLLRPGGFLVLAETTRWLEGHEHLLQPRGLDVSRVIELPSGCWWSEYYDPLKRRLESLGHVGGGTDAHTRLRQLRHEVEMVEADPTRFDCAYLVAVRSE